MPQAINDITSAKLKSFSHYKGQSAHDFHFMSMDGCIYPLAQLKGKLILIVNTATQSGLSMQFMGLEELWQRYKGEGLVVIATPCNDFSNHEPLSNDEIDEFCRQKYKVTFPLMRKVCVSGERPHPFYQWAENQVSFAGRPRWSFHKYLIGPDGKLITWFAPFTSPLSNKICKTIDQQLKTLKILPEKK